MAFSSGVFPKIVGVPAKLLRKTNCFVVILLASSSNHDVGKADDTWFNICLSTNVAALVQQMLNSVSCHVNVEICHPFNKLNVVGRC